MIQGMLRNTKQNLVRRGAVISFLQETRVVGEMSTPLSMRVWRVVYIGCTYGVSPQRSNVCEK